MHCRGVDTLKNTQKFADSLTWPEVLRHVVLNWAARVAEVKPNHRECETAQEAREKAANRKRGNTSKDIDGMNYPILAPDPELLELAWLLKDGDYHQQPVKLRALALQQLCERTLLSIGEDVSAKYENLTEMVKGPSNLGPRPTSSRTTPSHHTRNEYTHIHPHPRSRR